MKRSRVLMTSIAVLIAFIITLILVNSTENPADNPQQTFKRGPIEPGLNTSSIENADLVKDSKLEQVSNNPSAYLSCPLPKPTETQAEYKIVNALYFYKQSLKQAPSRQSRGAGANGAISLQKNGSRVR